LRFQVRASTFFQKCRDQQWYINQLLRQQNQNLTLIRDLKDRLEREQMKSVAFQQSTTVDKSNGGKLTKLKIMKDSHVEDLLLLQQQQQAILNDATATFSITDDLKKLSSDASRNRNRSSENRKTTDHKSMDKPREKSLEKAKQSVSAPQDPKTTVTTTTSLAISFSSPNLATNTSFSSNTSSSDSDFIDCSNACGSVKIQNPLDDISSLDDHDNGDESLNLAGENDVEYAELTQRMIFPQALLTQKPHNALENAASSEESDLMIMNLFEGSGSINSDSALSSSTSLCTAPPQPRLSSSVLENIETAPPLSSLSSSTTLTTTTNGALACNYNSTDYQLPSELHQETAAHSLPLPLENSTCASPVWKTQVRVHIFWD
jgi:hypothetical protein